MRVDNAQNSYFRYALPIQSPIGFPRNLSVVWHQQQSARMFNVHRDLPDAVAGKFMGPHLRQRSKGFQIFGRHQVGQPLADPSAVIRPVPAKDGFLVSQLFGELRANKRDFHDSPLKLTPGVNSCQQAS